MRHVLHFPSSGGHGEYDLYALAPAGMSLEQAILTANEQIRRANTEAAAHDQELCDDGLPVEDSIKGNLNALGFEFFTPMKTRCWDEPA